MMRIDDTIIPNNPMIANNLMYKLTASRRDFIFFILLILLIKVAHNDRVTQKDAVIYAPATQSEEKSTSNQDKSLIHEPDEHILQQLHQLIEQAELLLETVDSTQEKSAYVKEIQERLLYLKSKYEHISPAIALLGPLGTTGIVLQEQTIENELKRIQISLTTISNEIKDA